MNELAGIALVHKSHHSTRHSTSTRQPTIDVSNEAVLDELIATLELHFESHEGLTSIDMATSKTKSHHPGGGMMRDRQDTVLEAHALTVKYTCTEFQT